MCLSVCLSVLFSVLRQKHFASSTAYLLSSISFFDGGVQRRRKMVKCSNPEVKLIRLLNKFNSREFFRGVRKMKTDSMPIRGGERLSEAATNKWSFHLALIG